MLTRFVPSRNAIWRRSHGWAIRFDGALPSSAYKFFEVILKIAILPGDGIGPEIIEQAVKVLNALDEKFEMENAPVGGAGYEAHGHPLPEGTLKLALEADAVLFGAVGDWKYDKLD